MDAASREGSRKGVQLEIVLERAASELSALGYGKAEMVWREEEGVWR